MELAEAGFALPIHTHTKAPAINKTAVAQTTRTGANQPERAGVRGAATIGSPARASALSSATGGSTAAGSAASRSTAGSGAGSAASVPHLNSALYDPGGKSILTA